jgi:hypothetical protein
MATTSAGPLAAPVPRQLDLPVASTTAPPTRSDSTAPGESTAVVAAEPPRDEPVETALDQPVDTVPSDPPTEEGSVSEPEFRLTAISTRDGEPIALLNDRLVREGDRFDGVRVIRIGVAEIEIEVDGERRTIGF